MKLELDAFEYYCHTSTFEINGITADEEDFGLSKDLDQDNAEEYGCGNRQFIPLLPRPVVLEKYDISLDEYYEVCGMLVKTLSFGKCGLCA